MNENHQQFGKKVKITTSLVALFGMLPKPRGGSGQESAAKLRMGIWCGDNGLYTGLDLWLIRQLVHCRMFAGLNKDRFFNGAVVSPMCMSWILIPLITEMFLRCLHLFKQ